MSDKPPKLDWSYDLWTKKLVSWVHTLVIESKKHGHLIILHSLEKTLQEGIYENENSEELIEADGAKQITKYLNKKFKVADDEFIEYRRADEGSMIKYL